MELSQALPLVRRGDELAWEFFVRTFQGRVFGLAYHYTAQAEDARDLTQDVFVRIYQNLALVPDESGCLPWIIRITRNACIDHLRRRKARPPLWDLPADELFDLRSTDQNPEEAHLAAVRKTMVHRALQELTDLNREVILLKEIQGLGLEEIAAILEVPVGTVKSRSNRARLELAQKLCAAGMGG
ncbi:RNA polymerase sigma factor [Geothrix sp. PMB-07]|uniref:RNA polymerase sigma factor n=1 Tax=Geothrix sp. PMB-07 TaxID=3068640 RepID=UPI0027415B51|nr:sigma-70 family RNA polymerase sigma factor [Geothrix sp. PMB-07]WLT32710.1 sigma-70 family RNA polymerase sigma factor [Geothrix sp. PMB-07]